MSFISVKFLVFISAFLLFYIITESSDSKQNYLILFGNYIFYSLIDIRFSLVLFLISIFTWYITSKIEICKNKYLLFAGISLNIGVLLCFKYIGLFMDVGEKYGIVMPIGLSFYVFEAVSLLIDTYNGKMNGKTSLLDVLIYLSFFPIVISGPIMKARDFLPQIHKSRRINQVNFENGLQRFVLGTFEKVVVADRLAISVAAVYSAPAAYSGVSLLWNSLSYTLQLFFDFAGYSNMAIGLATILGFSIGENFNLPYIAKTPSEFWRRWHISLSSWITEYVYIPLGGNRRGRIRTYINIMTAMLISGIWHGSTLNFLLWGSGHGIIQVIQKIIEEKTQKKCRNYQHVINAVSTVITFVIINFLWIPFRTTDLSMTGLVFKRIFTNAKGLLYLYSYTFVFGAMLLAVEIYAITKNGGNNPIKPLNLRSFKGKFIFVTMVFVILMFAYFGNSAFIYGAMF